MIRVEKIDYAKIMECRDVFSDFWGPGWQDHTQLLFNYKWPRDEIHCGLALKDGDQTVGFIGLIFSRRRINGRIEKFCNLTSWVVQKQYRNRSISLLLPLFAMRDYTITDLSPSRTVYRIQKKLGFKDLNADGRLLLPFGRRLFQPKYSPLNLTHDLATIENKLEGQNLKIFNDHKPYRCFHFLMSGKNRYCYIIYTILRKKRISYVHLHYISDTDLFALAYRDIRKSILSHANAYFLLIDSRLVKNKKLPISLCLPYRAPKQYMSSTLKPEQIDNLYSELVMLNLRSHPRLKYLIRNVCHKLFRAK